MKTLLMLLMLTAAGYGWSLEGEMKRLLNLPDVQVLQEISTEKTFSYELRWFLVGWQGSWYLASAKIKAMSISICTVTQISERQAFKYYKETP